MRAPVRTATLAVLAFGAAACASACFLGYDSQWGQAKSGQRRVASETAPAAIASAAAPDEARGELRTWRVRFRPNAQYLAQTIDAQSQIAHLVEDANGVLSPIGLRLELERIEPWTTPDDEKPADVLARLQREDPGADVDLVVGMFGALPGHTDSLHEVGMAARLGKHLVVRAAGRLGEHDAVEQAFSALGEDERAGILKLRKRHRALAVFLHEVGHCLGALHEADPKSLMNPAYSPKASGFGGGAVALMRAAIAGPDKAAVARAQLELLDRPDGPWIAAERDDEIARLRAFTAGESKARVPSAPAADPAPDDDAPPELPPEARDQFVRARQAFRAGAVGLALQTAQPLFAAYPRVYAVQDLRCQIAAVRWLPREKLKAECAPFERLLPATDAGVSTR
jgi:hypothetical protein